MSDRIAVRGARLGDAKLRVRRRQRGFLRCERFLIEFFAGTKAGEHDRDASRVDARKPDHVVREIDDAHGLAHVEHEDLAAFALQTRLQKELGCLGQRHEKARDVGVRDGHRAAARDLLGKTRYDAARTAEHVAEANQHELRAAALETLADDFGEAFRRSHHICGIYRFIR